MKIYISVWVHKQIRHFWQRSPYCQKPGLPCYTRVCMCVGVCLSLNVWLRERCVWAPLTSSDLALPYCHEWAHTQSQRTAQPPTYWPLVLCPVGKTNPTETFYHQRKGPCCPFPIVLYVLEFGVYKCGWWHVTNRSATLIEYILSGHRSKISEFTVTSQRFLLKINICVDRRRSVSDCYKCLVYV